MKERQAGCNLQETSGRHLQVASSSELRVSANSRTIRNFAALFSIGSQQIGMRGMARFMRSV
jgi:uncharacterized protein (DUF2345 family)